MAPMKALLALLVAGSAAAATTDLRPVHRYIDVKIAPDARNVASVEGDSPVGAFYPELRELIIRPTESPRAPRGAVSPALRVDLPCGRVPQCWPGSPAWSPDGTHLSFTVRTPGSHRYAIYRVAADGSGLRKQLEFNGTLLDLKYAPDGRLAMLATADARKEVGATEAGAAISGDLDAPTPEQRIAIVSDDGLVWASPPDLFVYEYEWRPGTQGFVGTAAAGDGDDNWWVAKLYAFGDTAGSTRVLFDPPDRRHQIANPVVSRDGRTVAFISGIMSDFGSTGGDVYTIAADGGTAVDITPDMRASATSIAWSCAGRLRAMVLAGSQTQLAEFAAERAPTSPKLLWSAPQTLRGGRLELNPACPSDTLAMSHESFTAPPEIFIGKIGSWHDLTALNAGLADPLKAVDVTWQSDGYEAQGWLLLPAGAGGTPSAPLPMVTIVHGGPAAASTPSYSGPGLQRDYLERGWAVFRPNPRGSFGQGERYATANVRDFGYGDLRDILAGIDAAEKAAPIDEHRLGLTGGSYGGFMTMWAVTQTHRFKAAVAAAGISDWLSYYGENGIDGWMIPYFGASAYEDPAIYAKSSAINFIRNVSTPTFAYVGERDIECPAPQTQEFWHAMKAIGVPTSVMIYPGEGHGIRDPSNARDVVDRTLAWFDRYLH